MAHLPDLETHGTILGGILAALIAALMWARRLMTGWAKEGVHIERAEAEKQLLTSLREEILRLAEQNGKLARTVNELQIEVAELRGSNTRLQAEIDDLRSRHGGT